MTIDDSRSEYYDDLFDRICESLPDANKTAYEELEYTLTQDNDAWRKMVIKYRNQTLQVIKQADNCFTPSSCGDACSRYKKSYIVAVINEFKNFLRSSLRVYDKYSYEKGYEMLAVQQDYVKEWAKTLRERSSLNKPRFNEAELLSNDEILYMEMLRLIAVRLRESKVAFEARALLRESNEQNQMEVIGWKGSLEQLNFIHAELVTAGFIMPNSDFMRHFRIGDETDGFEENSIVPIFWYNSFSLLVYLLEELKRKRLFKLGLNFQKISETHFIKGKGKDRGFPWTGHHQAKENYRQNQFGKPRGFSDIDHIIARIPA